MKERMNVVELITKGPKGTADILPPESKGWVLLESVLKNEAELNGFSEVRTPLFEHTELFLRGVGDTTDVVEKQMYTFEDKGGRSITLRPEGTAGVVRAMLESGHYNGGYPIKLYYVASCYRYEKPQKGRLRELHQFGVEVFGADSPAADAQVIALGKSAFDRLGLKNVRIELNSIGCPDCRARYHDELRRYFGQYRDQLCDTCLSRLQRNPMRILDCKSPVCAEISAGAPKIIDYICDDCREHFDSVKACLDTIGIEYTLKPELVRGLDYYTRTVFEFVSGDIGSQSAIGGGGRYDRLVEELGGKPTSGLGFGLGLDRIMLVMQVQGLELPQQGKCELYIAPMGQAAQQKAFQMANALHHCGVSADFDICGKGLKAQMKYADKIGVRFSLVLGDNEMKSGLAELKNMKTGEKATVRIGGDFTDDYLQKTTELEGGLL